MEQLLVLVFFCLIVAGSSRGFHVFKTVTPLRGDGGTDQGSLTREEYLQWQVWRKEHSREYNGLEDELRRISVWLSNKRYVEEHNRKAHIHGFELELNSFGDLTLEEWRSSYSCHKIDSFIEGSSPQYQPPVNWTTDSPPYSIDWRSKNAVTKIKDQEEYRCHSCYAFAAIGALEGAHAIATGQLIALSTQQILDCSKRYANSGCRGGNYKFAWNYLIHSGGSDRASCYPYKLKKSSSCRHKQRCVGAKISDYSFIQDESRLKAAVGHSGPVAISFDHSQRSFQFYSGGVYNSIQCSSSGQDASHEMVVVGYGRSDNGKPYWIVKNSYGRKWGIQGYMLLHRGSNMCGVASNAAIPTISTA